MTTVYLAGGIFGLSDSDATDWREYAKRELHARGYSTLDPMRRDYRGREDEPGIAEEIVHGDVDDIRNSDVIIAMAPRPSWGTAMEVALAHRMGVPVLTVVPEGRVSPWLAYHSERVCRSLDEAIEGIE